MNNFAGERRSHWGLLPGRGALRLYDRVVEILRAQHYSIRTQQTYCDSITRFIHFHNLGHPSEMAEPEGIVAVVCADSKKSYEGQKLGFRIQCGPIESLLGGTI